MVTLVFLLALAWNAGAVTTQNDASCDIAVMPAATLLLPYFEVDLDDRTGETTLFTVTNVTSVDQVARVTLWTDYAYPVINFNIYLTGYDVQSINLYDILARAVIAPPYGIQQEGTGTEISKRGRYSDPNAAIDVTQCDRLPGNIDPVYLDIFRDAFMEGRIDSIGTIKGCEDIGGEHDRAVGYATIDVVATCDVTDATDAEYWTTIRYDNVLTGDYQQLNVGEASAQGGPMVHIRAVPEGGTAESRARLFRYDVFERTFYSRYQSPLTPNLDGRQPLPATFAARWIRGGTSLYQTSLKIWREGSSGRNAACGELNANGALEFREAVVFDENENAAGAVPAQIRFPPYPEPAFPATSRTLVTDTNLYPQLTNGSIGGWLYLNLDRDGSGNAGQAWVTSSMRALGRYSTDIDATALGNGCSEPARISEVSRFNGATIAPAPNDNRIADKVITTKNDDSCDIAQLPAATLLLPYFEVGLDETGGVNTLFTVTNVSPGDQIARVTLWTDLAVPVVSFNLYLTGYDVQSINLFDVLKSGAIGTPAAARGQYSDANSRLDIRGCDRVTALTPDMLERLADAFQIGTADDCKEIGNPHANAVGYATIDVVRNCDTQGPLSPEYWREDIAYDNVLTGDYQQLLPFLELAGGSPLVHIRAVPEGGREPAPFERTFYASFQTRSAPKRDGRQPLPSLFAARWINGSASGFQTSYLMWRESATGARSACGRHEANFIPYTDVVVFDEAENAWGDSRCTRCDPPIAFVPTLPSTARVSVADTSLFPHAANGATGGWAYFNLDDGHDGNGAQQAWVVASMSSQNRFSVQTDATALGNGCSAPVARSEIAQGTAVIGPP
ncbi:MAG TPA: hypothetical protein VF883_24640 [Thermoanaerobaculia bacterium]